MSFISCIHIYSRFIWCLVRHKKTVVRTMQPFRSLVLDGGWSIWQDVCCVVQGFLSN
jgi:hypothetical protein